MLALFQQRFPSTGLVGLSAGVDVSDFQDPGSWWPRLDWAQWVCAKTSEGSTLKMDFDNGWGAGAIARGIPWGLYHFARFGDVGREAQNYLASMEQTFTAVGAYPAFHMLDLEASVGGDVTAWSEQWCRIVESVSPRPVVIYTGPSWANAHLTVRGTGLENRPLWIAHYASPGVTGPWVPALWSDWTIWQWTSTPAGIGNLDTNAAKPEFLRLIGSPHALPNAPMEDDMARLFTDPNGTTWSTDGVHAVALITGSFSFVHKLGLVPAAPEFGEPATWEECGDLLAYDSRTDSMRPIRFLLDPAQGAKPPTVVAGGTVNTAEVARATIDEMKARL